MAAVTGQPPGRWIDNDPKVRVGDVDGFGSRHVEDKIAQGSRLGGILSGSWRRRRRETDHFNKRSLLIGGSL